MSSSSSSLPTPRQLLTSILNAISEIPPPPPPPPPPPQPTTGLSTRAEALGVHADPPSCPNPLKRLDPSHRPLFTTLHVLFPSLLLPALDLLDRGLVTRLVHPSQRPEEGDVEMADDDDDDDDDNGAGEQANSTQSASSPVYVVRSAQHKPTSRHAAAASTITTTGQTTYIVQTAPWNCTCAAFSFAAFPPAPALSARTEEGEVVNNGDEWGFGGMSFDGMGKGCLEVPPCCKHLLACVLAERWAVLAGYVNERQVGREELAGIFADI